MPFLFAPSLCIFCSIMHIFARGEKLWKKGWNLLRRHSKASKSSVKDPPEVYNACVPKDGKYFLSVQMWTSVWYLRQELLYIVFVYLQYAYAFPHVYEHYLYPDWVEFRHRQAYVRIACTFCMFI